MVCPLCAEVAAPVVCKRLLILRVQRSSRGEHDGGVQVSNNSRNGTGGRDASLSAFVSRLQS